MYIYLFVNKKNGKCYVGQTAHKDPNKRMRQHRLNSRYDYLRKHSVFLRAMHKYGWAEFDKYVLEVCNTQQGLDDAEKFWIEKQNSAIPNGYNVHLGGGGLGSCNPETKRKLVEIGLKRRSNPESRAKCRETSLKSKKSTKAVEEKQFVFSEEHRRKMSENRRAGKMGKDKLSMQKATEIREKYAKGDVTLTDLAQEYGVCKTNISLIINFRTWNERPVK